MRYLVVDDHEIVRGGLAALLSAHGGVTTDQAASGTAMFELLARHDDVAMILLDLRLAQEDGLALLATLRDVHPDVPVVMFSGSEAVDDVRAALRLGARGYIPKSAHADTILAALDLVAAGQVYAPPLLADVPSDPPGNAGALTARQLEILRLLDADLPNLEIAYRLQISESTVKAHVTAIFRALGVVSRRQAARAAHRRGLI